MNDHIERRDSGPAHLDRTGEEWWAGEEQDMQTWRVRVYVPTLGASVDLGTVGEDNEELARCAALSEFGSEGDRPDRSTEHAIFEDDEFEVAPC